MSETQAAFRAGPVASVSLIESDKAAEAVAVAPRVSLKSLETQIKRHRFIIDGVLTLCILELHNGYKVVGQSAPASLANFDAALGERFAYDDAVRKVWPLEGYLLCEKMFKEHCDKLRAGLDGAA